MTSVSVVIPTIGRVNRLKRALQSVASQTKPPHEVIVVSKCDKSKLTDVIDSIDISITVVEQSGNGLSNARNEGVNASSGTLVAFLDDDDWWKPKKLEYQVQTLSGTDSAFVFTGIEHVDSNGNTINFRIPTSKPDNREILVKNAVGAPSTVLAKRTRLEAVGGFDETLPSREEWDLYIRLLERYNCEYISKPLIFKESHAETISRNIDMIERDWMALFEKHENKYDKYAKKEFFSNYYFDLGRISCKNGHLAQGRKYFKKSIKYNPDPTRAPHYIATFFGEKNYEIFTSVYRTLRKIKYRLTDTENIEPL